MDLYMGNDTRTDYDFWGDPGNLVAGKFSFYIVNRVLSIPIIYIFLYNITI